MIHPTAIIDPKAKLDSSVAVGPYSVIEAGVEIGKGSRIGPHCHFLGNTSIGSDNIFHAGCVIGDAPQDLSFKGLVTELKIGSGNIFREHVTVHRSAKQESATEIGEGNFFLANCHVAHNCKIGNHVVVVNGVLLAGYVEIEDRAFIGGACAIHQFCRIGTLAMLRGVSRITKDVPPYCMAVENNELVGLNSVGLKRAGFSLEQRSSLKEAYATLFGKGLNLSQALEAINKSKHTLEVEHLLRFIRHSKRGICMARKKPTDLGDDLSD